MRTGKTSFVSMSKDQEIEHGELDEEFKCRVTRPLVRKFRSETPEYNMHIHLAFDTFVS